MMSADSAQLVCEVEVVRGRDAIADVSLLSALASTWSAAYRASSVPAQRDDALYLPEHQRERISLIRKELGLASALLTYVRDGDEVAAFFWGLTLAELEAASATKAADIRPFAQHPAERVAYLSMLGVRPSHARRGLAKELTRALCAEFAVRGATQVLARTINEQALVRVYRPLGFEEYQRFADPRAGNATRILFGSQLPLA